MIRSQRSPYGTSLLGAGAVHHIKLSAIRARAQPRASGGNAIRPRDRRRSASRTSRVRAQQRQPQPGQAQQGQAGGNVTLTSERTQRDQSQSPAQSQRGQRDQTQGPAPQRQQDQQGQTQQRQPQPGQAQQGQAGGNVTLTSEQRTRIQQTVLAGRNVPRVDNVNFSISVGTAVPSRVRIVDVPPTLIEINPAMARTPVLRRA